MAANGAESAPVQLAARPDIILADEPTGQLDSHTGKRVLDTMRELASNLGITLVIVTHDPMVMNAADTVHEMSDGYLVNSRRSAPTSMPR